MTYTIARYPVHLIDIVRVANGSHVTIRPTLPQDLELQREFFHSLSVEGRYRRFMSPLHELPAALAQSFSRVVNEPRGCQARRAREKATPLEPITSGSPIGRLNQQELDAVHPASWDQPPQSTGRIACVRKSSQSTSLTTSEFSPL